MKDISVLKEQLLKTLSFYEAMTEEFIYLDLDENFLHNHKDLTIEDLKLALNELKKEKKIKEIKDKNQTKWIRLYPKKSFFQRLSRLFRA